MKILFVADGRSPISRSWMRYFARRGDDVFLASTFACELDFPIEQLEFTPVAFSAVKKPGSTPAKGSARTLGLRTRLRHWLGPLTIPGSAQKLRAFIEEVQPDVIHAMRIPYEGMLTASALAGLKTKPRFIVSIWGNDFTLHAPSTPLMSYHTRRTMRAADALHADCERDIRLARVWGLGVDQPTLVTPGNGGIQTDVFYPPQEAAKNPVVINPRGFRAYVKNEAFFKSIPLVLEKCGDARFVCSSMQGEAQALQWMKQLGIEHAVRLDPPFMHAQMGDVFRAAQVIVSPSIHDGTPNSLLEGMACGCFPVVGDLESIREWITHGQNGFLVDPNDPQSIADAILIALEREDLRREAAGLNAKVISARAEYGTNMEKAVGFYKLLVG
jgi:glycosyltransferase involved in cell wall biosynthesis